MRIVLELVSLVLIFLIFIFIFLVVCWFCVKAFSVVHVPEGVEFIKSFVFRLLIGLLILILIVFFISWVLYAFTLKFR